MQELVGLDPLYPDSPLITIADQQFLPNGEAIGVCAVILAPCIDVGGKGIKCYQLG